MVIQLDEIKFTPADPRVGIANFSQYFGQRKLPRSIWQNYYWGGGNASINIGDKLYVKKSGKYLSTITANGFAEVDVDKITTGLAKLQGQCKRVLETDYTKDFSCVDTLDKKVLKLFGEGSVETGFHAKLAGTLDKPRWNMHDHNSLVNGLLCSKYADFHVDRIFKGDKHIKYMPFIEPGAPLSIRFNQYMDEWRKKDEEPSVILMGQHGKIQTANSPKELCELADYVVDKVRAELPRNWLSNAFGIKETPKESNPRDIANVIESLKRMYGDDVTIKAFTKHEVVQKMLHSREAVGLIEQGMPNPDAAVYAGAAPMVVNYVPIYHDGAWEPLKKARRKYVQKWTVEQPLNDDGSEYVAKLVLVPRLGAFAIGKKDEKGDGDKKCNQIYSSLLDTAHVMAAADAFGGMKSLSYKHLYYINNWKAEHRREVIADKMA